MNKSRLFIYSVISILMSSCSSKPTEEQEMHNQEYNTSYFQINIPSDWQIKKMEGIDVQSLVYFIAGKDTIVQEISSYANSLTEEEPNIKPYSATKVLDSSSIAENKIILVSDEQLMRGIDIDKFRKQNVNFKVIDAFEIKIISTRRSGKGITGFFCDSIGNDPPIGRIKVNMYGKDLNGKTEKELLDAISTIKFHKN
jgi:hypothetical protein